jgi:hypothetical protein
MGASPRLVAIGAAACWRRPSRPQGCCGCEAWGCSTLNRGQVRTCNTRWALDLRLAAPSGPLGRLAEQTGVAQRAPRAPGERQGATWHASAQLARLAGAGRSKGAPAFSDSIKSSLIRPLPRPAHKTRAAVRSDTAGCAFDCGASWPLGARHVLAERAGTCREAGQAARHLSGAAGQNSSGVGRAPPAQFGQHTLSAAGARACGAAGSWRPHADTARESPNEHICVTLPAAGKHQESNIKAFGNHIADAHQADERYYSGASTTSTKGLNPLHPWRQVSTALGESLARALTPPAHLSNPDTWAPRKAVQQRRGAAPSRPAAAVGGAVARQRRQGV